MVARALSVSKERCGPGRWLSSAHIMNLPLPGEQCPAPTPKSNKPFLALAALSCALLQHQERDRAVQLAIGYCHRPRVFTRCGTWNKSQQANEEVLMNQALCSGIPTLLPVSMAIYM